MLFRYLFICTVLYGILTSATSYADDSIIAPSIESVMMDSIDGHSSVSAPEVCPHEKFNAKDLILPGALITLGSVGLACPGIKNSVKRAMDNLRGSHYFHIDDYIQYLPVVAYAGLGLAGVKARHSFKERLAVGLTTYVAMAALVNTIKYTVRETRPDSPARNSFPSGHTATVFTGAELIRMEYSTGVGIAAYTVATGVAFLRLYNGRHWLNDVLAGAGIGILSARIGYWMLPLYRKWFGWNNNKKQPVAAFSPSYDPAERAVALNLAVVF